MILFLLNLVTLAQERGSVPADDRAKTTITR